jgi:protocatechuate 3,4-dioxygenase beta subunit
MDNDDILKGRVLSRREILGLFGLGGAAALVVACTGGDDDDDNVNPTISPAQASAVPTSAAEATATTVSTGSASTGSSGSGVVATTAAAATSTSLPSCIVLPALTEGPYFIDEKLDRSDIRAESESGDVRPGTPLVLTLNVVAVSGASCAPQEGAMVDVWHCDALGAYSGFNDNAEGFSTVGEDWLRGFQTTDSSGRAEFTTIYPGWYRGRATHIHFKVRKDNMEFTSQWFFDDFLSDEVHANETPYNEDGASGRLQNAQDSIYNQSNGMLQLDVQPSGDGYAATFTIGIQM